MSLAVEERIAALEARVAELTRVVDEQRHALAARQVRHSMARTRTCPACGGGSILVVKQVGDFAHAKFIPFSLNPSLSTWKGPQPGEPLHVYVCKECRLVEWHVDTLDHLVPDGDNIVELTRPNDEVPASEPYR